MATNKGIRSKSVSNIKSEATAPSGRNLWSPVTGDSVSCVQESTCQHITPSKRQKEMKVPKKLLLKLQPFAADRRHIWAFCRPKKAEADKVSEDQPSHESKVGQNFKETN